MRRPLVFYLAAAAVGLALWGALFVLAGAAMGQTATDVGGSFTSSNPTGEIAADLYSGRDRNLLGTPGANFIRLFENAVNLATDPSCSANGANNKLTLGLDTDESASANAWAQCYELKTGTRTYTTNDGSILAHVQYDASGNATYIELWPQGSGVDQANAATVGTLAWAEAAITAGGTIYLHPGQYWVNTADSLTFNRAGVTLEGASREGTQIVLPTAFNGTALRIGFTGSQLKGVTFRNLEINGNKGNVTSSILIHARDAKFTVENCNLHDAKTGGILMDATVFGTVKPRIMDSQLFNFTAGAYGIKTSDDQGECLTDAVIMRNEMGAATLVIDNCINGLQFENNHIYGYLTDQACIQGTGATAAWDWRIANNTIEDCGREGIILSGGGADRGAIIGNTFYGNGCSIDNTYDTISLASVDASLIANNIIRSAVGGACPGGMTRHGIYLTSANNNRILGNMLIGSNAGSYAVNMQSGGGTNTVALNQCSGTCAGNVSDTILNDAQFNVDATYGWLMRDAFGVLPDGTNGVAINTSGVLAKVGTGSVLANDVTCTDCVTLGTETAGSYAGSVSEAGPATTATALAANGADCSAGNYPLGVDASGAVESCTADDDVPESGDFTNLTGGAGITVSGGTISTDSTEQSFLASGALTCGASTNGKVQVHTTPLQYCDNTGTPTLRYAAYGSSAGVATSATALAANGSNCSAGSFPLGVDASGASETCTAVSFTAAGTSGTPQTISNGDTLTVAAGTGITTTGGATDTVTVAATLGTAIDTGEITDATIAQVDIDDSQTLAGNPANGDSSVWFANTGLIFEGTTSDTNEGLLIWPTIGADRTLTLPDATDTLVGQATTDVLTNKTLDVEGTGNSVTTVEKIWMPFASCQAGTGYNIWDTPTSNGAAPGCVAGTNTLQGVADFDATTDESLQATVALPADWTGTVDGSIQWLAASTTSSVAWCVQLICVADAETNDPAFPAQATGNCVSDAAKGTTLQTNNAALTSITATGCAAGELLHVRVSRDPDETSTRTDAMTGDARGIGLELTLRRVQ